MMTDAPVVSVVDDDFSVRESLDGLLRSAGLRAELFHSGRAFLDSEALEYTDCLVLDMDMPGMTGPELQRELAVRGYAIPVIFITGGAGNDPLKSRLLTAGARGLLRKPFADDALLHEIDTAVSVL